MRAGMHSVTKARGGLLSIWQIGGQLQDRPRTFRTDGIIDILLHHVTNNKPGDLPELG
jgi:hypothetical protein